MITARPAWLSGNPLSVSGLPARHLLAALALFLLPTLLARSHEQGQLTLTLLLNCLGFAALYTALCLLVHRLPVWKLSLAWLGLPFLLFSLFWLKWLWAVPLTLLWAAAFWRTAQAGPAEASPSGIPHWGGYLVILVWVYLSGAGGHGLQKDDYILHSSRLLDLMEYPWPVHYHSGRWLTDPAFGPDFSLLVVYCAYYLPAAVIGKAFGQAAGFEAIHVWTLMGCWLAYRWVLVLSGLRFTTLAAVILVLFAGWDSVIEWRSLLDTVQRVAGLDIWQQLLDPQQTADWAAFKPHAPLLEPNFLDFWPTLRFHTEYFVGHYVSHSASLFWSPHQTIAAWLAIALLAQAWLHKQEAQFCLLYALLTLWSPMNMMALALFPLVFVLRDGWQSVRRSLSWENAVAGGSLLLVFSLYYTSGSALTNPGVGFLWNNPQLQVQWVAIFHVVSWGLYALVIALSGNALSGNALTNSTPARKEWLLFTVLCTSLLLLPLFRYGEYSDLMTRGSTSLLFLLMVLYLKTAQHWWTAGKRGIAIVVLCLLLPGTGSGLLSLASSLLRYNEKTQPVSVIYYGEGWLFMGSTQSPFARWLAE